MISLRAGNLGSPLTARGALVDTSAYYALADERERAHKDALSILDRLTRERWQLYTTNFILAETHALALRRRDRHVAYRILSALDHNGTIVRVNEAHELHAREILARYDDKNYSLTDAMSFAVMDRLGIAHAFAFDDHFRQYGKAVMEA
jgi:predicted nucleic acid-binding protein